MPTTRAHPGPRLAAGRLPLLGGAAVALVAGLFGGVALLVAWLPAPAAFTEQHGPLMALGFLGTLISLERAVALRRLWGYAAPALSAFGAVALAAGAEQAGKAALTAAAGWLVAVYVALLGRRVSRETLMQLAGALAWFGGGLLWLAGRPIPELVVWFAAFHVLTIAAERLELAHVVFLRPGAWGGLVAAAALVGGGALVSLAGPAMGARTAGAGMVLVAVWLAWRDVARHTVRGSGLPRYAAVCLLAGYAWLGVAGVLWAATGLSSGRYLYDAALHALFLGFVMSMVFGHAPVILPAVLRVRLPYRPVLYAPLTLLHVAVAARVAGDLAALDAVRTLGGVLAVFSLLLFAGCAVAASRSRSGHDKEVPAVNPVEIRKGPGAPSTPPQRPRASWHLRANAIVVGWLALAVAVALAGDVLPAPRWLLIHVFLLGGVSTAILIWSEHFTVALLRTRTPAQTASLARLALLNAATIAILYGVAAGPWQLAAAGAGVVVVVVLWHAYVLVALLRRALPGRFGHVIGWYVSAAGALAAGGVLGGLLAAHVPHADAHERMQAAHAEVNLLGWVGLTVLGTLFTLWPTVLRTRMPGRTRRASRIGLWLAAPGLAVTVAGLLTGWRWAALAGLAAYAAGTVAALAPLAEAVRRRRPHTGAAWTMGAGVVWFGIALVANLAIVATRPAAEVTAGLDPLLPLVLAGFVAQVLLGSLLHLLPAVLGGGPARFKENAALLERGWAVRLAAFNLGVPLLALPVPAPLRLLGWALVLAATAAFVTLATIALTRSRALGRTRPAAEKTTVTTPGHGPTGGGAMPLIGPGGGVMSPIGPSGATALIGPSGATPLMGPGGGATTRPGPGGGAIAGGASADGASRSASAGDASRGASIGGATAADAAPGAAPGAAAGASGGDGDGDGTGGGWLRAWPGLAGVVAGILLTAAAVVVSTTGGEGTAERVTATGARTVEVTLAGMSIRPSVIEAAPGTVLTLRVTNTDAQRHDLRLATGERTPLLGRGESATLTLPPLAEAVDGWCTVAGHRAAGMTMRVVPAGTAHGGHATGGDTGGDTAAPARLDLSAPMSPEWTPHDATLKPAPGGVEHQVEIRVDDQAVQEVAPGVRQRVWTFNGKVPGPVLRGKVGDTFTVTFVNGGTMGHGIDFHAGANAPDEVMRTIEPGERLTYRFRAGHAGAWLYHCSTMPMTQHIANGMYGAVVIDPPELPEVDREYLLVQGELHLGEPGSDAQVAKIREGRPDGWMFNGTAAGYDHAPLAAKAGERVRIWAVAAGPSSGTALHVVGAPFDTIYKEGAYRLRKDDAGGAQVLDLAPAQGGFAELVFPEAGTYPVVDHTMRQAEAGAHGLFKVSAR
ncbi:multicopper oxidase domain-containing protein [Nonomuraea sp. NPDC050478]|uniref:multicopper oxidase domain-containing protein n=1 Tax=Nonomuraea sp. NPDC050478 TaxID=3364365 RepID=UPI00379A8EB3